jgi:signal transduction histidine kinase
LHLLPTVTVAGEHYFHTKVRTQRAPRLQPQWLHILYPERVWRQARWQAAYPPLLVGAAALAVVFALSMTLAGRLSLPIRQLQTQVSRIAQGHFAPMPLPRRHDELRDLIASVNALVRDLVCLSQAIKRSERLALMGQLSGGLAHHLRNAIAGAKLALQLHQRHCHQGDPESLAVAQRQLQLTEEQLQRFLSAGQPPVPSPDRTELPALVAEVARLVAPMCQHRRVVWQVQLGATTLPEVRVDRLQVHEALLNLVLNAIEAAGPDGWVRVESAPADNGQLVLRVLDSGPGPPPELRSRLFEPFVTGKPEGIGLGLAATKQIAEAHGGTLRFVEGRPTCFELALPVAEGHPAATDRPAVAEESRPRNNDDKTREASGRGITNTE